MITKAWASFSVADLELAEKFYSNTLELEVEKHPIGMLEIRLPDGGKLWIYPKDGHDPASFTVLNLCVANIDTAVDKLNQRGVVFEQYPDFNTDDKGIARHPERPAIAWFKDPFGNILALMENF